MAPSETPGAPGPAPREPAAPAAAPASQRTPRRDYAPWARRVAVLTVFALAGIAVMSWMRHHPALMAARLTAELRAMPAPDALPVPVQGVAAARIADTWGAPRGRDRAHQGVDIFAPRGTPVLSATEGLVTSVRDQGLGGRQVWVLGPAHERHYYAHLDDWAPGLRAGDRVRPGRMLGTVGDTGNARGTPPHLHYGIYTAGGAIDPLPRLRAGADAARDTAETPAAEADAP